MKRRRRQEVLDDLMRNTWRVFGLHCVLSCSVFDALERSFWFLLDILGSGFGWDKARAGIGVAGIGWGYFISAHPHKYARSVRKQLKQSKNNLLWQCMQDGRRDGRLGN